MGIFDFLVSGVTYETVEDEKKNKKSNKASKPTKQESARVSKDDAVPDDDLPIVKTPSGATRRSTVMELNAFDAKRLGSKYAAFEGTKVYEPNNFKDIERLLDLMFEKTTLIVLIKKQDELFSQRVIDYVSGASYVLNMCIDRLEPMMYYVYYKY